MTTPKRTKFQVLFQFDEALDRLFSEFSPEEVKEIIKTSLREALKRLKRIQKG